MMMVVVVVAVAAGVARGGRPTTDPGLPTHFLGAVGPRGPGVGPRPGAPPAATATTTTIIIIIEYLSLTRGHAGYAKYVVHGLKL